MNSQKADVSPPYAALRARALALAGTGLRRLDTASHRHSCYAPTQEVPLCCRFLHSP